MLPSGLLEVDTIEFDVAVAASADAAARTSVLFWDNDEFASLPLHQTRSLNLLGAGACDKAMGTTFLHSKCGSKLRTT